MHRWVQSFEVARLSGNYSGDLQERTTEIERSGACQYIQAVIVPVLLAFQPVSWLEKNLVEFCFRCAWLRLPVITPAYLWWQ